MPSSFSKLESLVQSLGIRVEICNLHHTKMYIFYLKPGDWGFCICLRNYRRLILLLYTYAATCFGHTIIFRKNILSGRTCSNISSIIVKLTYDSCVDGYKNPHHLITHATGCKHPGLSYLKPFLISK
jgi:hypothetical protein